MKMLIQKDKFDNLTSNYSYEKGKIEQYIQEAESNRNYIRSKYQIEQEKFKGVIAVYPKIDVGSHKTIMNWNWVKGSLNTLDALGSIEFEYKGKRYRIWKIKEEQRVIPVGEKYNNDEETERKKITVKGYNEKG